MATLYMSIDKYNHAYLDVISNKFNGDIVLDELPYDIAEELCLFLSNIINVQLEDENYNNSIMKNGKIIDMYDNK